jgi:hypothetical protein
MALFSPPCLLISARFAGAVRRESQDESADAFFEQPGVEVDQQPDALVCEAEIRQKLRFEQRVELSDRLHFHEHEIFDDEIDPIMTESS